MSVKTTRRDFLKASVLVSAGTLLAACGPVGTTSVGSSATATPGSLPTTTPPPAAKKKIIYSSYTYSNYEQSMVQVLDAWVAENPNYEYEGQFVPSDVDYWAKVQTQVASGTPPDCGIADYGHLVSWAMNGTLMDITQYIENTNFPIKDMSAGATAQYRWAKGDFDSGSDNGKYYGIPSDTQPQVFVYNKKMFDDAGVAYPTDDWTWDDVLAAAQKITKPEENKWGIDAVPIYILFKGNFVWSAGGAHHTPDFTKSLMSDAKTVEAYKWNWDLIHTHKVTPPSGSSGEENPFMSGQVAMYTEGIWWITDFADAIKDFDWDVALLPKHPQTGKRTVSVEADVDWVYKGAKEPDVAWSVIEYLDRSDVQQILSDLGANYPSCLPEIAKDWYSKTPPEHRIKSFDNINMDSAKVDNTYFEFGTISSAVLPIIEKSFADGTDIIAAMNEADGVMNSELKKAWDLLKS